MKRKTKIVLALLLITNCAFSQSTPKYIKDVFDNIFRSMSNGTIVKPKLILVNDLNLPPKEREVATYNPTDKTIRVGQSFIELTRNFGADSSNARAHVLSHELAHLFLNHGYANIIGTGFASAIVNKELKKTREKIEDQLGESAADQCAFFYAYISGYSTSEIAPKLLDSIYINYQLTDKLLNKYPSLKERKNYALQASVKMESMYNSFDFANLCLIHGDYEMAEVIFHSILNEGFKSREVISNLGVSYLLNAISLMDSSEMKYVLPIQIDYKSRIKQANSRGITDNDEIKELLIQANDNFMTSTIIDPKYAIGYFNLSISNWLLGKTEDADFYLKKCIELNDTTLNKKIELYTAIKNLNSVNSDAISKGLKTLEDLSNQGYGLAQLNLKIYKNQDIASTKQSALFSFLNKLEKKTLTENFSNSTNVLDSTFKMDKGKTLTCKQINGEYTARKWKAIMNDKSHIIYQYTFKEDLNMANFTKENSLYLDSDGVFESGERKYFIFGDIIVIETKEKYNYQIINSK